HRSISSRALREPATNPPLPFLTLLSSHLPWFIRVYPSNNSFVTVDSPSTVRYAPTLHLGNTAFNTFQTPNDQRRTTRAYEQRY
ncbi:hypothetical protein M413DRAFT_77503, partial [Hebeloma cylindrosporum]